MFYVGQKVVCVNANNTPGRVWYEGEALVEDAVYTVAHVMLDQDGDLVLDFQELTRSPIARAHGMIGYHVRRFRPIVERKTDISIFTDMLTPKTEEVSA